MSILELEWTPTNDRAPGRARSSRNVECRLPSAPRVHRRPVAKATVLWMDDDPREWTRGAEHLMRCGYRVVPIPATAHGVHWVSAIAPDVVVLEVDLHEDDGMSLLRAIRTDNPSIPIVIYSRTDRYRDDFISWLADDYLHKADDGAPLCDAIDTVLAARR